MHNEEYTYYQVDTINLIIRLMVSCSLFSITCLSSCTKSHNPIQTKTGASLSFHAVKLKMQSFLFYLSILARGALLNRKF